MAALIGDLYSMNRQARTDVQPRTLDLLNYREEEEEKPQEEPAQPETIIEPEQESAGQETAHNDLSDEQVEDAIANTLARFRAWRGDDFEFSPKEAAVIEALVRNSDDPEDTLARYISASGIASMTGMDVKDAFANLDSISEYYTGRTFEAKDVSLLQKVKNGFKWLDIWTKQNEWRSLDLAGREEEAKALEQEIIEDMKAVGDMTSAIPKNQLDHITTAVLGNLGYIVMPTIKGIEMGAATMVAGSGIIAASALNPIAEIVATTGLVALSASAVKAGAAMEMAKYTQGQSYWNMMHDNEGYRKNRNLACILSAVEGVSTALIETMLDGVTSRTLDFMTGKSADAFGISALIRMGNKGVSSKAAKATMDWVTGWLDEGFVNELPEFIVGEAISAIYRNSNDIPYGKTLDDLKKEASQQVWDGILVGAIYGGAGKVGGVMMQKIETSIKLRRAANRSSSLTEFLKSTENERPEDVSQEEFDEARQAIYEASVNQADEVMKKVAGGTALESAEIAAEELYSTVDENGEETAEAVPDGNIRRDEKNSLEHEVYRDHDGSYTVAFGDKDSGAVYGTVKLDTDGNDITVKSVRIRPGYETIRGEMVLDSIDAIQSTETDVKWDPTTPGLQKVKQELIDSNPKGTGLRYEFRAKDSDADIASLATEIRQNFPKMDQQEAVVAARLYALADRDNTLSAVNNGKRFASSSEMTAEQLKGRTPESFRGATSKARALIYAGQNADFSTFNHELFHAVTAQRKNESRLLSTAVSNAVSSEVDSAHLRSFIEDHRAIWGKAFDSDSIMESLASIPADAESWTISQEENLARLYEAYRSSDAGQIRNLSDGIRAILRKIAEFMNRVYTTLRNGVPLNREIAEAYDRIMGIEKSSGKAESSGSASDIVFSEDRKSPESVIDDLKKKYAGSFEKSYNKQTIVEKDLSKLKDIIYRYPKIEMENGLQVIYGMKNDHHDLPMMKEYILAQIAQVVDNGKLILLPRYMDRMLNNIIGENFFDNYSLADGISAVSTDGRTFEFKYCRGGHYVRELNDATRKADVSFLVVVGGRSDSVEGRLESLELPEGHEVILVKTDTELNLEGIYKKKSANSDEEAGVAKITGSRPDTLEKEYPLINTLLHKLPDVNSNSQETMDYEAYSRGRLLAGDLISYAGTSVQDQISSGEGFSSVEELKAVFGEAGIELKDSDIFTFEGRSYVKSDLGFDYSEENIRRIKDAVASKLSDYGQGFLFSPEEMTGGLFEGLSDESLPEVQKTEKRGAYPREFTPGEGWSGNESNPTIEDSWRKFGYISFIGAEVRSVRDLVQMYSIYRNPMLEYFHLVFVRNGKIVRQQAISSGVSGMSPARPLGMRMSDYADMISSFDYDSVYLMHNHPSGNIEPSIPDINATGAYIVGAFQEKFKGHIIFDHEEYMLIESSGPGGLRTERFGIPRGYHRVAERQTLSATVSNPQAIANMYRFLKQKGNVCFYMDNALRIVETEALDISPIRTADELDNFFKARVERAKENISRNMVLLIRDVDLYSSIERFGHKFPFLDVILVDDSGLVESFVNRGVIDEENGVDWQENPANMTDADRWAWDKTDASDTLFQDEGGTALQDIGGTLVVTHNLTADNLRASIDIGGMPMPSIAVTHPDVKIDSFGEITLVGDSEMASSLMRNGEIFDRDMWSPVVPRPEYRIDRKAMQRFESWLEGLSSDPEFRFPGLASLMDYQKNNADSLASFYAGKDGVRLAYAREHGVDIDIPRRPARYSYDERIIKAALQWGKSNDARYLDYSDRTSFHNAISPAVEQVIRDRLEALERTSAENPEDRKLLRRRKMIESLRDSLSPDNYSSLDHLLREAWSYREGATEIDTQSLYAILEEKAPRDAVAAWLREEKLKDVFRDPFLKVGRRRVPYDAQGIFEYMENSRIRANEFGSLTYSNSLTASNGARALTSRKALSENEQFLGNTEDLYYNDAFENYHRLAMENYGSSNNAWDALDNSNRAIGKYLSSDTRTRAYMKKQLSSFGFRATEGLVSEAMKLVDTVDSMTRRYFEAKPRRIMQLSDFRYAIVPESIDEASMEELENAGLRIIISNNREQALSDIAGMDRSILFQEARRQEEEQGLMDSLLENVDSELEARNAAEELSGDYDEAVEIFPDHTSFDSEIPSDWDPDRMYEGEQLDPIEYEERVARKSRYVIVKAKHHFDRPAEPNNPYSVIKGRDQMDLEWKEFAQQNVPEVVFEGSEEEKDGAFRKAIEDRTTLRRYLGILGQIIMHDTPSVNAYYRQEYNPKTRSFRNVRNIEPFIDEQYRVGLQSRVLKQVTNSDVQKASKYAIEGKEFPKTTGLEAKVRREMGENARFYRNVLAALLGDRSMLPETLIENARKLSLPGRETLDLMSVQELASLAADIKRDDLVQKIKNGTLKFGSDIDEQQYQALASTIREQSEKIGEKEKELHDLEQESDRLEQAVNDLSSGIAERDALLRQADEVLEDLRKAVIGEKTTGSRAELVENYRNVSAKLHDLNAEASYQRDATAKGSREKGKAKGRSIGTSRFMSDLRTLVPEVFKAEDGHDLVWSDGKATNDNAEIRRNIEELKEDLEAELSDIANRITGSTLRQLGANADKVSAAIDSIAKSGEAKVATVDSGVLEQMKKDSADLKKKVQSLNDKLRRRDARIDSLTDDFKDFRDYSRALEKIGAEKQRQKEKLYAYMQKAEADRKHLERQMNLQKTFDRQRREDEISALKEDVRNRRREKRRLEAIRQEKIKIAKAIMRPVNLTNTDYDTSAHAIMAIQSLVDPQFRRDWLYDIGKDPEQDTGYGTMTIDQAKDYFNRLDDAQRIDLMQYMSQDLIDRLTEQRKPLNDWTVDDLKRLAQQIEDLRNRGREVFAAKKQQERARINAIQLSILEALAGKRKGTGSLPGSADRQKERKGIRLSQMIYATYRPQELAQLLDGGFGTKGYAYKLLVDDKRYHQNREWRAVEKRVGSVSPFMTEEALDSMAEVVELDMGRGRLENFTVDQLAYIYLSRNDESNRDAVAFGALLDENEKGKVVETVVDPSSGSLLHRFLYYPKELIQDDDELRKVGLARFDKAYRVAKQELQKRNLMPLVDAISRDFNSAQNRARLNRACIEAFNTPLDGRDYYLAIQRTDLSGEDFNSDTADTIFNLNANASQYKVKDGFRIKRIAISPRHQRNVNLSLINVWNRAVQDQEHLIENAAYVKMLRHVFNDSAELKKMADDVYSPALYDEIGKYIDLIANPHAGERKTTFDRMVRTVRGKTGAAYLGWKMSGIVLQGITSPMPALSEIDPAHLVGSYLQIAQHPVETINMINEKSIFMKNRTMNPIIEEAVQRQNQWDATKMQKLWNRQEKIGQIGLTLVDRYAVAGGWLAMYQKALKENLESGVDTSTAEAAAVQRADNFILRTQPVGDPTEMASMFRSKNELAKAVLQFQASLNVIWNNLVPNMVGFARNHEFGKMVGTVFGYALAGVILGVVANGFKDDDDTEKRIRKLAFWSLTQGLDSVPLFGSSLDDLAQRLVTGEVEYTGNGISIVPAWDKTVQSITAMSKGDWTKAVSRALEAGGLLAGAPTSGIKQAIRAIKGEPGALLGR